MKLQRFLDRIEDAPHGIRRRVAGQLLHLAVGEQVDVEFRPDPLQCAREAQGRHVRSFRLPQRIEYGAQHRRIVTRTVGEAFGEDDRNDFRIHCCRAEGILEGANEDRLVDESILRPAQPADFVRKCGPTCSRLAVDEKDFEIRPARAGFTRRWRHDIGHLARRHLIVYVPLRLSLAIDTGQQPIGDAPCEFRGATCVVGSDALVQRSQQASARVGVVFFCRRNGGERRLQRGPLAALGCPGFGQRRDLAPVVSPREWMSRN